ncbi:MAG: 4-hydroxy-tetrahydrodipicolinate reductase, partial [Planctomycetota bacterium]
MKPKVLVVGAAGRMGKRILSLGSEASEFDIVGAVERAGHPDIGKDSGFAAATAQMNVKLDSAYPAGADVAIDFSIPEAADKTIEYCLENGAALVLGTTGLSDEQHRKIKAASAKVPVIYGTNMSVGMNVLFALAGKVASMLGKEYDIEIVEQHHRFKKDAPSGSALTLAKNICEATGRDFPACIVGGRSGKNTLRQKGKIGVHAVRAGDIAGIHSVIFSTLGETV